MRAELFQRLILLSAHGFWFFILGAVASLGYGNGLLPFGPSGWKWIGNVYNYWRDSVQLDSGIRSRPVSANQAGMNYEG